MADRIDITEGSQLRLVSPASPLNVRAVPRPSAAGALAVRAAAASRLDSYQFSTPARTTLPTQAPAGASRIVAATVPGRVDFLADVGAPASGALPMYRHPADRNAAATAVDAGRVLDLEV